MLLVRSPVVLSALLLVVALWLAEEASVRSRHPLWDQVEGCSVAWSPEAGSEFPGLGCWGL
ncbi:hypothetical protein ACLRGI_06410, partial [Paenarthrobacter nitroguajacolicus]|uniref:hypothetical protein n=1 Tax=Paenarthrobacter nitroguajacolicus TaxID=211146 RepID=UPI003AEE2434